MPGATTANQHPANSSSSNRTNLPLGNIKGQLQIVPRIRLGQLVIVEQMRLVAMDERTEAQPILPAAMEVGNVDRLVALRLALAPQQ